MTQTMAAVVQYALEPGAVEIREMPVPQPGAGEVLLRVRGVGVCGSDVHQMHNTQSWSVRVPVILGHEFCGTIAALGGGVKAFREGELVASETAADIDADSPLTRIGQYNLDPARRGFGYDIHGAMAEYVAVPARLLHRVPAGVPAEIAAMTEPCCVAYQATVVNARVRPGDVVVVIGPGPIGLLCATMARLSGAGSVILAGMPRDRRRMATGLEAGATHAAESADEVSALLNETSDGLGADVVVDAAGVSVTLKSALAWVRPGGQITKVGWGAQPLDFSLDPLVKKAVTLTGSFSHTWAVWERVLAMLGTGQLDPRPYLSRVAPITDWKASFDGMHAGDLIKPVLIPMNQIDLNGQFAIVTGGARGIGYAIAERLLDSGATCMLWDRDGAELQAAAGRLATRGVVHTTSVNVADPEAVDAAAAATFAETAAVDILVNNAGIAGVSKPMWECTPAEWQEVLQVNLFGVFLCCRAIVPHMITHGYGRIVNVASIAGKEGNPNASHYSAAKAGVIGMAKSLGKELAEKGILVNSIAPAVIETAILEQITPAHVAYMRTRIPMNRFGRVEEAAALVAWLASRECSFSTGAVYDLSGGRATY